MGLARLLVLFVSHANSLVADTPIWKLVSPKFYRNERFVKGVSLKMGRIDVDSTGGEPTRRRGLMAKQDGFADKKGGFKDKRADVWAS